MNSAPSDSGEKSGWSLGSTAPLTVGVDHTKFAAIGIAGATIGSFRAL